MRSGVGERSRLFAIGVVGWSVGVLGCAEGVDDPTLTSFEAVATTSPGPVEVAPPMPPGPGPAGPPPAPRPNPTAAPVPGPDVIDGGPSLPTGAGDASTPGPRFDAGTPGPMMIDAASPVPDGGAMTSQAQCLARADAVGVPTGACSMCLCQADTCLDTFELVTGDPLASDLAVCQMATGCTGACCLCGGSCSGNGSNFGQGPCGAEVQAAAGVTPQTGRSGLSSNGSAVQDNCASTGPAAASCARTVRLGECAANYCASVCTRLDCGP